MGVEFGKIVIKLALSEWKNQTPKISSFSRDGRKRRAQRQRENGNQESPDFSLLKKNKNIHF